QPTNRMERRLNSTLRLLGSEIRKNLTSTSSNVSNIDNGLLPAAFSFGVTTTQNGIDIGAHLGLYPGIATNDGGSPNLQASSPITNTALGSTGLDIRQVYMTFGNKEIGRAHV